jgi:hypothetical protein
MTEPHFCIQSKDDKVLHMYFFAFVGILLCHKLNKVVALSNVDNLMVTINQERVPSFGSKVNYGGYTLESMNKMLKVLGLTNQEVILDTSISINEQVPNVIQRMSSEFVVDHAVLSIIVNDTSNNRQKANEAVGHVVVCSICNGKPVVYDSNQQDVFEYDWRTFADDSKIKKYLQLTNQNVEFEFEYVCYVKKTYIDELQNVPEECNQSYKVNNIIYALKRHLQLENKDTSYHFIIYNNEFVTKNIFDNDHQVIQDGNMFLYAYNKNTIKNIKNQVKNSYNSNDEIYIICGTDCKIERGFLNHSELRTLIQQLKTLYISIYVFQVVLSGVHVGYISKLEKKYSKQITNQNSKLKVKLFQN